MTTNQAREALIRFFTDFCEVHSDSGVDCLLAWLWVEGFKIVPVEEIEQ